MNILVIGGGGREHAVIKALKKSKGVEKIYALPGNGGIAADAECYPVKATDLDGIAEFTKSHKVDFAVVTPDDPLVLGCVDRLEALGIPCFGPRANAAVIEGSKVFSKDLMKKYGIPTAESETFSDAEAAIGYLKRGSFPAVIKADGLALGKGVIICNDKAEACAAIDEIMTDKKFGEAGNSLVVERFITGYEVSLLAFVDGEHYSLMPTACDHKRALDGDEGLNTGGMGAYSPCPVFTRELLARTEETVVKPTVRGMKAEGAPFTGVLYFGLMVDGDDVRVLEYNARFGDPETQSVLPLLQSDLYEIFLATVDGTLDKLDIKWSDKKSINVVLASGGYPLAYEKGKLISGLDRVDGADVYFAGVRESDGMLVTNGGRVLCVQAMADDFAAAKKIVYDNIEKIKFDGCFYRRDIGKKL